MIDRWCNQLNPTVKRGPFTAEEDRQILAAHAIHGNKWAIISRTIPGRCAQPPPSSPPRSTRQTTSYPFLQGTDKF